MTDKHLCNIINIDVDNYNVPDNTKFATVRLIYKRKSRNESENYRPISLLNAFTKIYERYILNYITPFVNNFFPIFISADGKSYGSNYVLIRLTENWKQ